MAQIIKDRRTSNRLIPYSMLTLLLTVLLQFATIIWWSSTINTKTAVSYEHALTHTNVLSRLDTVEMCSVEYRDVPIRVAMLERDAQELKNLPSTISSLTAKFENVADNQKEIKSSIDRLMKILLAQYKVDGTDEK